MGKNNAGAVSEKANTSAHVQVLGVGADTGCTVDQLKSHPCAGQVCVVGGDGELDLIALREVCVG